MYEIVFFILLLFINLLFAFHPVPIIAFPIGLFSIYMGTQLFLVDVTIPYNPYTTLFFILLVTCSLLINSLSIRGK